MSKYHNKKTEEKMKRIPLTQGKFAIVDDENYEWLMQWEWYAHHDKNTWYARRNIGHKPNQKAILMHRLILNTPKGYESDHRDGDGLNNTIENLRVCTTAQNQHNSHRIWGVSKFRGVCWHTRVKKWMAQIKLNGKKKHLGYFATEGEAAVAYDKTKRDYLCGD